MGGTQQNTVVSWEEKYWEEKWVEKKNIEELREAEIADIYKEHSREITLEILILLLNTKQ